MPYPPSPPAKMPAAPGGSIILETVEPSGLPKAVWWLIAFGSLAGALALVGLLLLRRRAANAQASEDAWDGDEEPQATKTAAPSAPVAEPAAQPTPPAAPLNVVTPTAAEPAVAPAPAATNAASLAASPPPATGPRSRASGELIFDPIQMRLSLVYATLTFRFTLRAVTAIPPGLLHADMFAAHASYSQDEQLCPPLQAMPVLGRIPRMAAGQAVALEGELQLPLSAIRPVHEGNASFFVPLVRLAMRTDPASEDYDADLPHLELGCVFTIGLPSQTGVLAPLRMDTGPRDFSGLDVREIAAARRTSLLPLDPARAAS